MIDNDLKEYLNLLFEPFKEGFNKLDKAFKALETTVNQLVTDVAILKSNKIDKKQSVKLTLTVVGLILMTGIAVIGWIL